MLVAIAIATVVVVALYSSFISLTGAHQRAAEAIDRRRELTTALDLLRRETSSAFHRPGEKRFRMTAEYAEKDGIPASTLRFASIAPPSYGDRCAPEIIRVVYATEVAQQGLTVTRESFGVQMQPVPHPLPLLERTQGFLAEFSTDGATWQKNWDSDVNGGLPPRFRVTIFIRQGERVIPFQLQVEPGIR